MAGLVPALHENPARRMSPRLSQMHKISPGAKRRNLRFSLENRAFAQKRRALTSQWPVNMLRAASKRFAREGGVFRNQAAPEYRIIS
jgi:hypothetical protein